MGSRPNPGDLVRVVKGGLVLEGVVMPTTEFSDPNSLVIKLSNGYNVGVDVRDARIEVLKEKMYEVGKVPEAGETSVSGSGKMKMSFISTGGTIVSKVEYETGAVKPAITAEELIEMVPEYKDEFSSIEVLELYRILSEDFTPHEWGELARITYNKLRGGADAVVIAHGTDTMAFTAAALAFSLRRLPTPVMLVGAQRSSDRPSTDSVLNLKACPVIAREAPFGEVVVVMHGSTSDTYVLAHRGVKVRKMHSSRRDAFQSVNDVPLARVDFPSASFKLLNRRYLKRSSPSDLELRGKFSDRAALIKFYPSMDCGVIDHFLDKGFRGIVLEGTGLGHVRNQCISSLRRAVEEGVLVAMTTQTLFGRVNMKVYTTGRKLLEAGVIPASDMLPETAYVKMSWLLGNYGDLNLDELRKLFLQDVAHEINPRHELNLYPRWFHGE
ncbi:MAG: Glu-tRNA(Gln) amidotransferase subunit GatD [Desulfurococcales archaeon]|nr:Glu-tRNA(Gln) amidotransferase subunit GatD [Desulfurococcales archaeon]